MTQPLTDKIEALKTLLPLLWCHLSLLPGARTVQRYGDAEVEPGEPKPPWALLDCRGVCVVCTYKRECRGEPWESMARGLDRKYRLATIAGALVKLDGKAHQLAHAVIAVYVEPYDPKTEPIRESDREQRQRWADAGVRWLAREIRGDLVGLGEVKLTTEEQVERLVNEGVISPTVLAQRVGCTVRHAKRLKHAVLVRSESTTVRS